MIARSKEDMLAPSHNETPGVDTATATHGGAGMMVLGVVGFLALSAVYMESVLLPALPGRVVSDLAFLVPLTLDTILCFIASRRSRGVEARFWLIGAALNAVLLVAEVYWLWWVVTKGSSPPAIYLPFQIMHVIAAGLGIALLAAMVRMSEAPAPIRWRWWLDLTSVAVIVYVLSLVVVVDPLLAGVPGATLGTRMIAAGYTSWGTMVVLGAMWTLARPGVMRWRRWERLIAASMMIYAAGTALWPVWFAAFENGAPIGERSVLDLVLVLGHYFFLIAAAGRLRHPDRAWPMRSLGPARSVTGRMATYLALSASVVALPALVVGAVLVPEWTGDRLVLVVAAAAVAALMVVRTVVTAIENGRLAQTSVTDPVTGLRNHRYFHEHLASEMEAAQRFDEALCVLWFDLDGFGRFNRLAGHAAGDDVLRSVARVLESACGEAGTVCRVGGDEFAVVARGAQAQDALEMAARVGETLRAPWDDGTAVITVSGGIAGFPADAADAEALAAIAEHTAVWAHGHRKGQVIGWDPALMGEPGSGDSFQAMEERTRLGTLKALAAAVDARLEVAGNRSTAVSSLAGALSRELRLDDERVRLIETAALVRDVGMVALGDEILTKPGPLTEAELAEVRKHPALGEQIVGASAPPQVVPWIRYHHERWDGEGYPEGLRAVAIPLESRIIAVCDSWDAMTSERPYRGALTPVEAVAELRACAGSQFDPEIVEPLIKLVEAFHRV